MTVTGEERVLRYVEGYGLRPHADGLDVVGGRRTARLKVKDPRKQALTLRLVELLRSGHSLEEAAARLQVPIETARARTAPLIRLKVLTYAEPPAASPPQMARFLERTLGIEAAAAALDRLAASTVLLDGDDHTCELMAGQLRHCGVGTVANPAAGMPVADDAGAPVLWIRCGPSPSRAEEAESDRPMLFVTLGPDAALVGPLCDVPGGLCRHCVDLPEVGPATGAADVVSAQAGAAIAVGEAVRLLSGTGYCRTSGGVLRVRNRGREQSFERLVRDAGCPRCGLPGVTDGASIQAYRTFQAADVPLKQNWSRPLGPLEPLRTVDSTIKMVPWPDDETRALDGPGLDDALTLIAKVFAPAPVDRRKPIPSVGGTGVLNVFVCGTSGDRVLLNYLDRRHGVVRALPGDELAGHGLALAGQLTVVVAATLSRAETVFGSKSNLTIHQDTGYALGVLGTALAESGFDLVRRPGPTDLPEEVMRALSLSPGRDAITTILDVPAGPRPGGGRSPIRTRRPRPVTDVRREHLETVLAAAAHDDVGAFVRCVQVEGVDDGLYEVARRPAGAELRRVSADPGALDAALADRGIVPAALILFGSDIGPALTENGGAGIGTRVIDQARSAQLVRDAADRLGLDAVHLSDLPSTALAPDGRGRPTRHRSFAAVAIGPCDSLAGADQQAVRW